MLPLRLTDELLQALPFPVVEIGNRFSVLAVQIRQQPRHVLLGIGPLFRCLQRFDERTQERFQPWQYSTQQSAQNLGILEQFIQPDTKTSFHRLSPFSGFLPTEKSLYNNHLRRIKMKTQ